MEKYIIVQWSESQYFIDHPQCYLMNPMEHNELQYDSAYFVPENVYNEIMSDL